MSVVLLIHGHPGNGKSYLGNQLKADHAFGLLSLDATYVEFIKEKCPILDIDSLSKYIGPHYDHMLKHPDYSKEKSGRDFVAEWHAYLRELIEKLANQHDKLAVEGYVLYDFKDGFVANPPTGVAVFVIEVRNRTYNHAGALLTVEQLAKLGS